MDIPFASPPIGEWIRSSAECYILPWINPDRNIEKSRKKADSGSGEHLLVVVVFKVKMASAFVQPSLCPIFFFMRAAQARHMRYVHNPSCHLHLFLKHPPPSSSRCGWAIVNIWSLFGEVCAIVARETGMRQSPKRTVFSHAPMCDVKDVNVNFTHSAKHTEKLWQIFF